MARNKRHLEPKVKKEEIELVAMALLKEKGYDNTSMAEIARRAGVATNTIYWYFENKDDVLIESAGSLMTDVHSRVSHSPNLQAWHDQFHRMVEQLSVTELVKAGVSADEAQLDAKLLIYVIEGLLAHPHKLQEREQIIDQALKRVFG